MVRKTIAEMELLEFSAVDRPAQEHARALITKRELTDQDRAGLFAETVADRAAGGLSYEEALASTARDFPDHAEAWRRSTQTQKSSDEEVTMSAELKKANTAIAEYEALLKAEMRDTKCSRFDALHKIRKRHPDEFETYRKSLQLVSDTKAEQAAKAEQAVLAKAKKSRGDFMAEVKKYQREENVTHTDAMSAVRQAHPDLFEAYQARGQ